MKKKTGVSKKEQLSKKGGVGWYFKDTDMLSQDIHPVLVWNHNEALFNFLISIKEQAGKRKNEQVL